MAVRENGRQICHGTRRTKQCPFFAEQVRRELFQGIYGRILSHDWREDERTIAHEAFGKRDSLPSSPNGASVAARSMP